MQKNLTFLHLIVFSLYTNMSTPTNNIENNTALENTTSAIPATKEEVDFKSLIFNWNKIPCMRKSLLQGVLGGVAVGILQNVRGSKFWQIWFFINHKNTNNYYTTIFDIYDVNYILLIRKFVFKNFYNSPRVILRQISCTLLTITANTI